MDRSELSTAVTKALGFLAARQKPYGEFPVYRYRNPQLSGSGFHDSSPFLTTFTVYALSFVDTSAARTLAAKGLRFLLEQREPGGLWRYWSSRYGRPIDPDIDDMCCASFVIERLAPDLHEPGNQAAILANRNGEGLFKTWVRPPEADNDVEGGVNANVLLYLGDREETRGAAATLNRMILEGAEEESALYYLDPLALYYMVSRAYLHGAASLGACRETILRRIADREARGEPASAMQTAFASCAQINLGAPAVTVRSGVERLLATQASDGSWPREAFYCGWTRGEVTSTWWGSEELTTTLGLEALAKALQCT
jgi:hypothetical protein